MHDRKGGTKLSPLFDWSRMANHRVTEIQPDGTATCSVCGPCQTYVKSKTQRLCKGSEYYRARMTARSRATDLRRRPWVAHKKDFCESPTCQWQGVFESCQLDVDHIDGDKTNNDPSNYQTLCSNCHRLKTKEYRDWVKPSLGILAVWN